MKENVKMMFEPDRSVINLYLDFMFGHIPETRPGGLIEVSNLYKSDFFPVTDIEKACDYIINLNKSGQNVYITPSVLSPDTPETIKKRRAKDAAEGKEKKSYRALSSNFYYSNVCWVDLDEIINNDAFKDRYSAAKPNAYTITSRAGEKVSAHFWWSLESPCANKEELEKTNKGIIAALGGDKGTYNCTRLMKIGGSVAHPHKAGRVTQQTVFKFTDWMPPHDIARLAQVYKAPESTATQAQGTLYSPAVAKQGQGESFKLDDILDMLSFISPDNDYFDWLNVGMALHDAGAPFAVWDQWSAGGAKYPGSQALLSKWNSFTKGGGVSAGTLYYHAHSNGFRFENTKPNTVSTKPNSVTGAQEQVDAETGEILQPIRAIDIDELDLEHIPPRAWLLGTMAARKYVTMIAASPGAGKSIFTMQVGVAASAGKTFGTHAPQEKDIRTWIYNNEEGEEELRRRLKGILIHNDIKASALSGRFFMNSGEQQSICIARKDLESGGVLYTPDYSALKEEVLSKKIDLLIIDPFAETHDLSENSNDEIKRVAGLYRSIAIDCNCAVILVHHTRKGGSNDSQSSEHNSNMDNARGGGAQLGVVRRMFTLAKMDENTAKEFGISPSLKRWYVRLDDAKTNITAPAESAEWFKFKSLSIGNGENIGDEGDSIGVLVHKTPEEIMREEDDYSKQERLIVLERLARIMIKNSIYENSVRWCVDALLSDGYGKYKQRKLHDFLKETVSRMSKNPAFACEGNSCRFSITEKKSKNEADIIHLHIEELSCF